MNDPLDSFEKQLARLAPAKPDDAYLDEVAAVFDRPPAVAFWTPRRLLAIAATVLVAGAAAVLALRAPERDASRTAAALLSADREAEIVPTSFASFAEPAQDEGLVLVDGQPFQQFRRQRVISTVWENRTSPGVYRVNVPREEVFLVPVTMR